MRRKTRFLLLLLLAALVGGSAAASTTSSRSYARAQAAWAARPFSAYRARIVHEYQLGDFLPVRKRCSMTIEVRPGLAPQLLAGDCAAPLTLDDILARFAPYAGEPIASRRCGYGSCSCALSVFTVERAAGMPYPQRIARGWRDVTIGAGPAWSLLARAPTPLRAAARAWAEQHTPCPPGTGNHTPTISPIHSEAFVIVEVEALP